MRPTASIAAIASAFIVSFTAFFALPSTAAAGPAVRTHKVSMIYFNRQTSRSNGGRFEIWAVRPNGDDLHEVHRGEGAVVSPDGRKVFCICAGGIGVMNPDGSHARKLGRGHNPFDFSLSGTGLLAYLEQGDRFQMLHVVNADGSEAHTIYQAPEGEREGIRTYAQLVGPVISPDGTQIAFEELEDPAASSFTACLWTTTVPPPPACSEHVIRTRVIDTTGSGVLTLAEVRYKPPSSSLCTPEFAIGEESFSADGSALLLHNGCSPDTYRVMDTGGGMRSIVTPVPDGASSPILSPDGSQIAFTGRSRSKPSRGIFTMAADGSGLRKIAPPTFIEKTTSWGTVVLKGP